MDEDYAGGYVKNNKSTMLWIDRDLAHFLPLNILVALLDCKFLIPH